MDQDEVLLGMTDSPGRLRQLLLVSSGVANHSAGSGSPCPLTELAI